LAAACRRLEVGKADFTESADILSAFPWAERHKAEVCDVPLVLIGGSLPPAGSGQG